MKKIDNQKINFYFINFYKYIFFVFFTGVISLHVKKWNKRLPASPYTEWQEKSFK